MRRVGSTSAQSVQRESIVALHQPSVAGSGFPSAPNPRGAFVDPWIQRVSEVDLGTLQELMVFLAQMRQFRRRVILGALIVGAFMFGIPDLSYGIYSLLVYGTLSLVCGLCTMAAGSLTVRHLFLKEAARLGLTRPTSLLLFTRAQRRARWMSPFLSSEAQVRELASAVVEMDVA